jgi:hypothetical protein
MPVEDTSGFYKVNDKQVLFAPNAVISKTYTLAREQKGTYTYPIEGWYWFDSEQEAYTQFNLPFPAKPDNKRRA